MLPYSSLPYELKTSILNSISTEDALKCLQVNKAFRSHYLENGPFPHKIESVQYSINDFDGYLELFRIYSPYNRIEFEDKGGDCTVSTVWSEGEEERSRESMTLDSENLHQIFLLLQKTIRSCKTVRFFLVYQRSETEKAFLVFEGQILPRVKLVKAFKVISPIPVGKAILNNFHPRVELFFRANLNDQDSLIEQRYRRFERPEIYSRSQFCDCKIHDLNEVAFSVEAFEKTDGDIYSFVGHSRDLGYTIGYLLENGIPGTNEEAMIVLHLWIDYGNEIYDPQSMQLIKKEISEEEIREKQRTRYEDFHQKIIDNEGIQEIHPESEEGKAFSETQLNKIKEKCEICDGSPMFDAISFSSETRLMNFYQRDLPNFPKLALVSCLKEASEDSSFLQLYIKNF